MKYLIYNHQGAALPVLLPEALGAGDVSVTVTTTSKCKRCQGTGKTVTIGTLYHLCVRCNGTGQRSAYVPLKPVASGVAELVRVDGTLRVVCDPAKTEGPYRFVREFVHSQNDADAIERMLLPTPPVSEVEPPPHQAPEVCAQCGAPVRESDAMRALLLEALRKLEMATSLAEKNEGQSDAEAAVLCHACFTGGEILAESLQETAKGRDEKKTQATATGGWPDIIGAGSVIPGEPTVT